MQHYYVEVVFGEVVLVKMPSPAEKLINEYISETYQQSCAMFDLCAASDTEPNWNHFISEVISDDGECAGLKYADPPHIESKMHNLIRELLVTESHFIESLTSLQAILAGLRSEGLIKKMEHDVELMLDIHGRFVAELGDKIKGPLTSLESIGNLIYKHVRQAVILLDL